jgi:hypothetical protein
VGASNKYMEKINNNIYMKEFQKIYKRMNARVKNNKMTKEDFYAWSIKARARRELAIESNEDIEVFMDELESMEV